MAFKEHVEYTNNPPSFSNDKALLSNYTYTWCIPDPSRYDQLDHQSGSFQIAPSPEQGASTRILSNKTALFY